MANFIFTLAETEIATGTIVFPTDNFYCVLVTADPLVSATTRANLSETGSPSNLLTGKTYIGGVFSSDPSSFVGVNASAATGVVLCKRLGASPATSDRVIAFSDLTNAVGGFITITTSPGNISVFPSPTTGWVKVVSVYVYTSGARVGAMESSTDGTYYQLATRNGTVAFDATLSNPRFEYRYLLNSGSVSFNTLLNSNLPVNRVAIGTNTLDLGNEGIIAIRTPGRRIKPGTLSYRSQTNAYGNINVRGSNFQGAWTPTTIRDNANSTLLGSFAIVDNSLTQDFTINSSMFYETIIFRRDVVANNRNLFCLEFYNSQIFSETINFA